MILMLGRGEHCPRERQQQREMVRFHQWCQDLLRRSKDDFDPTTEQARAAWMAANVAQLTPG
jgi:hypothetical protein